MSQRLNNTYIFVRHAESQANVDNIVSSDLENDRNHLTSCGRKQALKLGKQLKTKCENIDSIVCSPFLRTQETTQILHSFFPKAQTVWEGALQERQMLTFESKPITSMHKTLQSEDTLWISEPFGIESYQNVFLRMHSWWVRYEATHANTVCSVVSHAVPLKLLLGWLNGYRGGYLSPYFPHMNPYNLQNAEYRIVTEKKQVKSCHVTRLNCG